MTQKPTTIVAIIAAFAVGGASGLAIAPHAQSQPMISVQSELAAHPRMANAISLAQQSYAELAAAPSDFGGQKAEAMADLSRAVHSMRRALFFRLRMDDRSIDALRW